MIEYIIIKYLLNKDIYNKYNKYISKDYVKYNFVDLYKILCVLEKLHAAHAGKDTAAFSLEDLKAFYYSQYPALKKQDSEAVEMLFAKLAETDISDSVIDLVISEHLKRSAAFELAQRGFEYSQGTGSFDKLLSSINSFSADFSVVENNEVAFVTTSLEELRAVTYAKPGVKWRLRTLNKMMGSLRQGDFGFIFTRPEVGKTTMLADQCSFFASQIDRPLIHFNNEEMGGKVQTRYYQAALNLTTKELFSDTANNDKRYKEVTRDNIRIFDSPSISKAVVESVCEKYNPAIIVIDSIDKITGFQDDRDDLVYKKIYAWARELSKVYGPVIGVCHASAGAEGKRWLNMDDVAYAKTAKQGEADWILGIGATYGAGQENLRHLHLPKNKLMGDEDTDELFRHGKLDVMIDPMRARYHDLMKFN